MPQGPKGTWHRFHGDTQKPCGWCLDHRDDDYHHQAKRATRKALRKEGPKLAEPFFFFFFGPVNMGPKQPTNEDVEESWKH